jgi:hypothetical protein
MCNGNVAPGRRHRGVSVNGNDKQKDITILDRYNNVAIVKVVASDWVDYLSSFTSPRFATR